MTRTERGDEFDVIFLRKATKHEAPPQRPENLTVKRLSKALQRFNDAHVEGQESCLQQSAYVKR